MAFPTSPNDGDFYTVANRTYVYNGTIGLWRVYRALSTGSAAITQVDLDTAVANVSGGGSEVYTSLNDLPSVGYEVGDLAFVTNTQSLYVRTTGGWYEIAIVNETPYYQTRGAGNYTLAKDGTPTVITLAATDPEGDPITWTHEVISGTLGGTTVTNVDNVFTITPSTNPNDAGTFVLSFKASDGVNIATDVNTFVLSFQSPKLAIDTAIEGVTLWDLETGPSSLTITDNTPRTITNNTAAAISLQFDVQGATGGANTTNYGGRTIAAYTIAPGASVKAWVGENGTFAGGGAASAIYNSTDETVAYIVAGGSGGNGGGRDSEAALNIAGGAGGGSTGGDASAGDATGATVSAGGAGGVRTRGTGQAGSFRQGGDGYYNSTVYPGGNGWAPGGDGGLRSGDGTQGGGGGGYYGGGGSGADSSGYGGGGGSGFIGNGAVGTTTQGGAEQASGKIVITVS